MCIGPITIYNPTFLITPPNEAIDTLYEVDAVLGTDFMNLAGELRLYPKEGRLILPAKESPMPALQLNLGEAALTMHNVDVDSELKDGLDGWLGVDFFLPFDKVTIDLPRMFVTVE